MGIELLRSQIFFIMSYALDGYKLMLTFNDGKVKLVDFEQRLENAKNMFSPLKKIDYFKRVDSDGITIVWPNGLDLCPDALYERGVEVANALPIIGKKRSRKRAN